MKFYSKSNEIQLFANNLFHIYNKIADPARPFIVLILISRNFAPLLKRLHCL